MHTRVFNTLFVIMTRWGSGIKTCRSHTATSAQGRASGRGRCEPAPLLAETGTHPPPDKLGPQECCSRSDHLLQARVSLRATEIKSICGRQSELLSAALSHDGEAERDQGSVCTNIATPNRRKRMKRNVDRVSPRLSAMLSKKSQERGPGPYLTKHT